MERLFSDQNGIPTAEQFVARVARETDAMPDDVAACVAHVETGAANGTVRVEELELGAADLNLTRARKFLRACGVDPEEAESTLEEARRAVVTRGGVVLRVRMAEARSGVDLLPIGAGTTLVPASAVTA
jgi:hypothetical protein